MLIRLRPGDSTRFLSAPRRDGGSVPSYWLSIYSIEILPSLNTDKEGQIHRGSNHCKYLKWFPTHLIAPLPVSTSYHTSAGFETRSYFRSSQWKEVITTLASWLFQYRLYRRLALTRWDEIRCKMELYVVCNKTLFKWTSALNCHVDLLRPVHIIDL